MSQELEKECSFFLKIFKQEDVIIESYTEDGAFEGELRLVFSYKPLEKSKAIISFDSKTKSYDLCFYMYDIYCFNASNIFLFKNTIRKDFYKAKERRMKDVTYNASVSVTLSEVINNVPQEYQSFILRNIDVFT